MRVFNGVEKFVFTDVRFPHEVEWIDGMGGLIVHIHSPEREKESGLSEEAREHSSETALDTFSFQHVVDNDHDTDRYGIASLQWLVKEYERGNLPKEKQYDRR